MKKDSFEKKIAAYVTLAAAYMAAHPVDANAQIIYTNVNPDFVLQNNDFFNLDLNNDGVTDFQLHGANYWGCTGGNYGSCEGTGFAYADAQSNNQITGNPISKLNAGDTIAQNNNWDQQHVLFYEYYHTSWGYSFGQSWVSSTSSFSGNWAGADNNYIGLKIKVGSNYYYGWARLTVGLTLLDYAYYDIPDHPILAGETDCVNNFQAIAATPDTIACGAAAITLSVSQEISDSIQWSYGGTVFGTGDYQVTANQTGNYFAIFTYPLCTDTSAAVSIHIFSAGASLSQIHSTTCDSTAFIDLSVSSGTPPFTYLWNNGSTMQDLYNLPQGNYSVTVTDSNGCHNSYALSIDPGASPHPVIYQTGNILNTSSAFVSYQWFLNNIPIAGATTNQYTPLQSGTYQVQVTGADSCTGISSFFVFIPEGINDIQSSEIQISVTDKKLYLADNVLIGAQIDIVNELGQLAASVTVTNQTPSADLLALPGGIYFYHIRSKQKTYSGKFIIE